MKEMIQNILMTAAIIGLGMVADAAESKKKIEPKKVEVADQQRDIDALNDSHAVDNEEEDATPAYDLDEIDYDSDTEEDPDS